MREELKNFTLYLPKEKGQTQQAVVFVFSSTSAKAVSLHRAIGTTNLKVIPRGWSGRMDVKRLWTTH